MSIGNRHSVIPFVAGKSVPLTDQRLSKVGYKTTKKQAAKYPSICVSVPMIPDVDVTENIGKMIPYVRAMLESAQDGIVRSLYESSDGTLRSVGDDEISLSACIGYLEAESTGARLTKERIEEWFRNEISESLSVVVAEKLGTEDYESEMVQKHVKVYRDILSMLAGGKTILGEKQIKGCKTALALATGDDEITGKLNARLTVMENKEKMEDLLEL